MAKYAYELYCKDAKFLDLRDLDIPFCDGDECYDDPVVSELKNIVAES